jgi:hypothetical protein
MSGHVDLGPGRVVDVEADRVASEVVVGGCYSPHPVEVHARSVPIDLAR